MILILPLFACGTAAERLRNAIPIWPFTSPHPKEKKNRTLWRRWVPDLTIEVVSERSRDRDYTQKREEYWTVGIKEYWIVDAKLKQVLILKRGRSDWTEKTLGPTDICETKLLPGFKLRVAQWFERAGRVASE